jgi:hypothetical protein
MQEYAAEWDGLPFAYLREECKPLITRLAEIVNPIILIANQEWQQCYRQELLAKKGPISDSRLRTIQCFYEDGKLAL